MTYLPDADYFVYYEKFPLAVRGAVTPNDDGTFSIFLNSRLSDAWQLTTYAHEVKHIMNDDFYNGKPIAEIEKDRLPAVERTY